MLRKAWLILVLLFLSVSQVIAGDRKDVISTRGEARVYARPDRVYLDFTVTGTNEDAKDALKILNVKLNQIKDGLKLAVIDVADLTTAGEVSAPISTSILVLRPASYSENHQNQFTCIFHQRLSVAILNITSETQASVQARIANYVDDLTQLPIDLGIAVRYEVNDGIALYRRALTTAVSAATENAKIAVAGTGRKIGKPTVIVTDALVVTPNAKNVITTTESSSETLVSSHVLVYVEFELE